MNGKVIAVVRKSKYTHIAFAKKSTAFCDVVAEGDATVLDDYQSPYNISENICPECESNYREWIESVGVRCPTVRCECDMISAENGIETCDSVVSAYRARELDNISSGGSHPVCENCYKWILSLESNGVDTPYENADAWLENSI